MDPLAEFAVGLQPDLKSLIEGDKSNTFEGTLVAAVTEVAGVTDPAIAKSTIEADANLKAALQARFATILKEEAAKQSPTANKQADSGNNSNNQTYTRQPATYAWVNPALSMIITAGFLLLVFLLLYKPPTEVQNNQVFNIALGALATAFATVIGFHFGSSVGSKEKDNLIAERVAEGEARPPVDGTPANG